MSRSSGRRHTIAYVDDSLKKDLDDASEKYIYDQGELDECRRELFRSPHTDATVSSSSSSTSPSTPEMRQGRRRRRRDPTFNEARDSAFPLLLLPWVPASAILNVNSATDTDSMLFALHLEEVYKLPLSEAVACGVKYFETYGYYDDIDMVEASRVQQFSQSTGGFWGVALSEQDKKPFSDPDEVNDDGCFQQEQLWLSKGYYEIQREYQDMETLLSSSLIPQESLVIEEGNEQEDEEKGAKDENEVELIEAKPVETPSGAARASLAVQEEPTEQFERWLRMRRVSILPELQGFLKIKTFFKPFMFASAWRKRWFTVDITTRRLEYYRNKKSNTPSGFLALTEVKAVNVVNYELNEFKIETQANSLILRAEGRSQFTCWVLGLCQYLAATTEDGDVPNMDVLETISTLPEGNRHDNTENLASTQSWASASEGITPLGGFKNRWEQNWVRTAELQMLSINKKDMVKITQLAAKHPGEAQQKRSESAVMA